MVLLNCPTNKNNKTNNKGNKSHKLTEPLVTGVGKRCKNGLYKKALN